MEIITYIVTLILVAITTLITFSPIIIIVLLIIDKDIFKKIKNKVSSRNISEEDWELARNVIESSEVQDEIENARLDFYREGHKRPKFRRVVTVITINDIKFTPNEAKAIEILAQGLAWEVVYIREVGLVRLTIPVL